jgi:cytochrome c peroxidase
LKLIFSYIIVLSLLAVSCAKETESTEIANLQIMEAPQGFPEVVHPEGNEYTVERWNLGKKLFYDPILSKDGSISCASCHDPSLAFSDNKPVSVGADGLLGTRNSPSIANVAYQPYYTREGGLPTLEMQILVPIQEHNEFNNNIVLIADTLSKIPSYVQMAKAAYDQEPSAFVITRALSQFERSMISGQSFYDLEYNYNIEGSMSDSAIKGKALFDSERTSCSTCHSGFNFSNYSFQNNGLYDEYPDNGRERLTQNPNDKALFKVPSLRNAEVTGPYMHDGSIATLAEVIVHYNSGGSNHINKNSLIEPLNLTETEGADLLAFLKSLTDQKFITNKNLSNE